MLVMEDKCKDLKMKIGAAEGKLLGIEGEEGRFVIDPNTMQLSPRRARE
jgi:hypothetical protein